MSAFLACHDRTESSGITWMPAIGRRMRQRVESAGVIR